MLTKAQGKGKWALPKNLPRLLKTIWQRKDVWKTLSQNKSAGTINPVYLPLELLNKTKNVSINKTLSITAHNSCLRFFPATLEEHPSDKRDVDRVLFWKTCNGHVGTLTDIVPMSLKPTLLNGDRYAHCLTGAVLLQLFYPNRFGLSFSSTLQGARLESFL